MKNTDDIHALTTAEIARQARLLAAEEAQIIEERAAIFKGGALSAAAPIDADERAARAIAKNLT